MDWTAPDPASTEPISITATLDEVLCYPDGASLETTVITSGGRYRLTATPIQSCYEPGDEIALTFEDLDDPTNDPVTNFLLTGPGSLTPTGDNTATLTYDGAGSVGVLASLNADPAKFVGADFIFGCVDLEPAITINPSDVDIFSAHN